jgi:hypothetical protein
MSSLPLSFEIGRAPFCKATPASCDMPGYVFQDADSSGCWTGKRGKCVFDVENFKKTDYFTQLVEEKGYDYALNHIPNRYYVVGTAPFCEVKLPFTLRALRAT